MSFLQPPDVWCRRSFNFSILSQRLTNIKFYFMFIKILILRQLGPDAAVRNEPGSWDIFIGH